MLIAHNVSCGLVLTGTDVGKEFLGLSEPDKKDSEKQAAAILSVLGVVSSPYLLQFNPNVLVVAQSVSGPYTVSIKTPIPSEWTGDGESVLDVGLDYKNCPSQSDDNPFSVVFSGSSNYSAQPSSARFLESGTCTIEFFAASYSSDMDFAEGETLGILPVIVTPTAVVVGN
ncbi:hypothetical protein ACQV5M_14880 [Leptospira sp. SA-E8]|uniref:hypothetical protein n=1 Tax=Leptospira sp. SA-E8 TaxID=3422259 RepID=UPI003EBEE009